MKLIREFGKEDLATVYIGENGDSKRIEFVESLQPPFSRDEKWVIIVSTLFGCPVNCKICDAGGSYDGKLSKEEIIYQIDHIVTKHYPDRVVRAKKFKIQFARMGEPAFNDAVLDVLEELPRLYNAPGLMPCISTIAPTNKDKFFGRLKDIRHKYYPKNFQLQFSIHSTDANQRNELLPVDKLSLEEIAKYGDSFFVEGGRKITLNFAVTKDSIIDDQVITKLFSPERYLIKITPMNPTYNSKENGLECGVDTEKNSELIERLKSHGFEVLLSIGELEENQIGSNCGQYIKAFEDNFVSDKSSINAYDIAKRAIPA